MTVKAERQGEISRGTHGDEYVIPDGEAAESLFRELMEAASAARSAGREVVVVQGLGFVGAAMAAVLANAGPSDEEAPFFVIGVDRSTSDSYWKIGMINAGESPIRSEDPRLAKYIRRGALDRKTLVATADERVYGLADVVVVDLPLNAAATESGPPGMVDVDMATFLGGVRAVGRHMRAETLVLIETTVPPGTTEKVALPALRDELRERGIRDEPLVAHSYERVMPGIRYVDSIERFWRTFAGAGPEAAGRARAFLEAFIDTEAFPLRELPSPRASELAKVLENSYRAMNIAFIQEWTRAAEGMGVDLHEVIESIAVRRGTHDNIRRPGFGVGGYCLTKDGFLAQWGVRELLGADVSLDFTLQALDVNYRMPGHSLERLRSAIGDLDGKTVLVAGVSYLADVADFRNSPSATFCDLLTEAGATPLAHDPYLDEWPERPDVEVVSDLREGTERADAVVFAVGHREYLELEVETLARPGLVVLDAQNIIGDERAAALRERGVEVIGVGKGHWGGAPGENGR